MKLYNYFRSSAAFRVRIALNLKGLPYDYLPIHLVRGDQKKADYTARNPQALVPLLELDDGQRITQSMAIIEYLNETQPQPPLLPADPLGRARVRALAQIIACDTHPLNNLRVLKYLVRQLQADEAAKTAWYQHWVMTGLQSYEAELALQPDNTFSHGHSPSLADCCLIPQIFNAQRFECDLSALPRTMAVFERCMALPAFAQAQPSACPDAEA